MINRRTLLGAGVGLAAIGAGAGVAVYRARRAPEATASVWKMSFEQPAGGTLTMSSVQGQPLLLNFWAPWCAPCIREMPMLDRFYRDQQARGWRVIGLAVDSGEPVREFLQRLPVHFPIGLAGLGGVEISRRLGNESGGLPFTVVYGPDGTVLSRKLGAVAPDELELWDRQAIPRA